MQSLRWCHVAHGQPARKNLAAILFHSNGSFRSGYFLATSALTHQTCRANFRPAKSIEIWHRLKRASSVLVAAYRNQAENGPNTRRAAIRACKYRKVLVDRHGEVIHRVHRAAREHTQQSKSSEATKQQHSAGGSLPKITSELTSELLHCLHAIPDPWPMAKIAIDMEKPAQWVKKMCRLYFADIYARKTKGIPTYYPAPGVEDTLQEVQQLLPDLEAKMIEFLAEWIVTLLSPATQIVKARAFHLTFMFVKEYWFREFYLGLRVTVSLDREEHTQEIIDGQVMYHPGAHSERETIDLECRIPHHLCSSMDDPTNIP